MLAERSGVRVVGTIATVKGQHRVAATLAVVALLLGGCGGLPERSFLFVRASPLKQQGNWRSDIYVMNADKTGERRLTSDPASDEGACWSPDGGSIAFQSDRDGNWEIYVMNANGEEERRMTNHSGSDIDPTWSPDGSKFAFASERKGDFNLYVMHAKEGRITRLTSGPESDTEPAWSPDGDRIAFTRYTPATGAEVFVWEVGGGSERRIAGGGPRPASEPEWSPDGSKIAFVTGRREDRSPQIYTMNADGGGVRRLTGKSKEEAAFYALGPSWSPDGSTIAFWSDRDTFPSEHANEIYFMNLDGGGIRRLTENDVNDGEPAWKPFDW